MNKNVINSFNFFLLVNLITLSLAHIQMHLYMLAMALIFLTYCYLGDLELWTTMIYVADMSNSSILMGCYISKTFDLWLVA